MFEIGNVLVSIDIAERFFCCNLDRCHGMCCIDGDAGAPVTPQELEKIKEIIPIIRPELAPQACKVMAEEGLSYRDKDGDLVLQTVEDANCIFTKMAPGGICLCSIDAACRKGLTKGWSKPASCALYPIRLKKLSSGMIAANYDRRKLCHSAEKYGRETQTRLYQFLEQPLRKRFGDEWYETLKEICEQWNLSQNK